MDGVELPDIRFDDASEMQIAALVVAHLADRDDITDPDDLEVLGAGFAVVLRWITVYVNVEADVEAGELDALRLVEAAEYLEEARRRLAAL